MNPTTMSHIIAKKRARRRSRGAALVEAALVLPVMLVFLGLTMHVHQSYQDKTDLQMATRAESLYYGSHNCKEQPPTEITEQGKPSTGFPGKNSGTATESADPNSGQGGEADLDGRAGKVGISGGLSRDWQLTSSSRSGSTKNTKGVFWKQSFLMNRTINAKSEVACNEEAFENTWTSVFQFMGSFAKSRGGF